MAERGCQRIAIYGLGQHTQTRADALENIDIPVVGFIDDQPPASGQAFGLPAVTPARAMIALKPDGVLLSSDAWEARLWENTAALREAGVYVRPIYGSYDTEPAATTAVV